MRKVIAVAALALFAGALAGQPKVDTAKEGKFTAKFPNGPQVEKKTAGGLTLHIYTADFDKGKGGYAVIYGDLPAEVVKAAKPEQVLESAEKGLAENFKAKVDEKASKATAFGAKKYPAREVRADLEAIQPVAALPEGVGDEIGAGVGVVDRPPFLPRVEDRAEDVVRLGDVDPRPDVVIGRGGGRGEQGRDERNELLHEDDPS